VAVKEDASVGAAAPTETWETLESYERIHVQSFIQAACAPAAEAGQEVPKQRR
jgi:hypothetical protein